MNALPEADLQRLLELRTSLRRFLQRSARHARAVGLTPAQHQLLLAIGGHPNTAGPTVGDVADYLMLRHHSAVGLIDRAVSANLVERRADPAHRAIVRLALTPDGTTKLCELTNAHREEIDHLAPTMHALAQALERLPRRTRRRPAPETSSMR